MTLRDILSAPFVLRCETIHREDGSWIRVVSYPELGCRVEGENTMELLEAADVMRVNLLLEAAVNRRQLGALRPPIPDGELADLLTRGGHERWIDRLDEEVPLA